jgi:hypothetical protein
MVYLAFLNKRHSNARVAMGKPAEIVDLSMMGKDEVSRMDKTETVPDNIGEAALVDDITDIRNEDFVYVY